MSEWPNVIRILHLLGGLRAINNPGASVAVVPTTTLRPPASFQIATYHDLFDNAARQGLSVIGCDFLSDPEEVSGLSDPDWRPRTALVEKMEWPAFEVQQLSARIGHAAAQDNNMSVFEKARHVATQLRICNWRLRDLSEAYHRHLAATCQAGAFKAGQGQDGRHSQHVFISAHAMFSELASLRDHLATFAAREIFQLSDGNVDNWDRLLRDKGFERSEEPLAIFLRAAASSLSDFGEYRNLFVHNAPLSDASGRAFVRHQNLTTPMGDLPTATLPLPRKPRELRSRLRTGKALESFDAWIEIARGPRDGPETLEFCHSTLANLVHLAYTIAASSPVAPRTARITAADTIGGIQRKQQIIPPLSVSIGKNK